MNLTITQAIERTRDLSGELKAARTAKADCAADVEAKDRMASIARQALTNAEEHEARLMAEREELAEHIAALVLKTGEPLEADQDGPATIAQPFTQMYDGATFSAAYIEGADFQAQALQNGLDRIGEALEASRS